MACSACSQRRQSMQGRIVPVNPAERRNSNQSAQRQGNTATQQGKSLRDRLRYTGR